MDTQKALMRSASSRIHEPIDLTTRLLSALVLQWKDKKPSKSREPSFSTSFLDSDVKVLLAPFSTALTQEGRDEKEFV